MQIDREAGWRETLAEVSLVDVGSQVKSMLVLILTLGVFSAIPAGGAAAASALGLGFHVPNAIWIALVVFFIVMTLTAERSYHEWTIRFFFPRMGFIGWLVTTAYITLAIEAFRLTKGDGIAAAVSGGAVYCVFVLPAVILLGLLELGHNRLMEKRLAADEACTQPA